MSPLLDAKLEVYQFGQNDMEHCLTYSNGSLQKNLFSIQFENF
jgi:hypothetical protein